MLNNVWTGQAGEAGVDRLILDFSGVAKDAQPDIRVDLAGATLVRKGGYPVLHQPGLFRVALDLRRESGKAADVRVQLRSGNAAMSEYVHYPLGA